MFKLDFELTGPIDLRKVRTHEGHIDVLFVGEEGGHEYVGSPRNFIRRFTVGGLSGPGAKPCNIEWIRDIVRQCKEAGVECQVKQLGSHVEFDDLMTGELGNWVTNDPNAADPTEWPKDLREMPVRDHEETK